MKAWGNAMRIAIGIMGINFLVTWFTLSTGLAGTPVAKVVTLVIIVCSLVATVFGFLPQAFQAIKEAWQDYRSEGKAFLEHMGSFFIMPVVIAGMLMGFGLGFKWLTEWYASWPEITQRNVMVASAAFILISIGFYIRKEFMRQRGEE